MKTTTFMACLAIMLLLSCKKTSNNVSEEKMLNLTAPSGQAIAGSMGKLKNRTASILVGQFGMKQDFIITNINYLPVEKGYAAIVNIQLSDGREESLGIVSGNKLAAQTTNADVIVNESADMNNPSYVIRCEGYCGCRLFMSQNKSTGEIRYSCGCDECNVNVIIQF